MKRYLTIAAGAVAILIALFQGGRYIFDYNVLSSYGKGYIWGNVILFFLGIFLIIAGIRRKKKDPD